MTCTVADGGPRKTSKSLRAVNSAIDIENNAGDVGFISHELLSAGSST